MSVEQTLAHLRRMEQEQRAAGQARASRLRVHLPEAASRLRAAGATRVVLFGSLAAGSPHRSSDVDLAVEGLPRSRYFELLADLSDLFESPIDLVRLEDAPTSLRNRVEEEGEEL